MFENMRMFGDFASHEMNVTIRTVLSTVLLLSVLCLHVCICLIVCLTNKLFCVWNYTWKEKLSAIDGGVLQLDHIFQFRFCFLLTFCYLYYHRCIAYIVSWGISFKMWGVSEGVVFQVGGRVEF